MARIKNPFPGVSRQTDRHGKVRYRLRKGHGVDVYLPGDYGSLEFRTAYETALSGQRKLRPSKVEPGSLAHVIARYLASPRYTDLSDSRKRSLRRELDWLRDQAGTLPAARFENKHVEALMDRKSGPSAANQVKKNLGMLFKFAAQKGILRSVNEAARLAYKRKTNTEGYHTWTEEEVNRFLAFHGPGTKARLALLIFRCTGASRQDAARMGRENIVNGRIRYARGKTGVVADLPILPELREELDRLPPEQFLFLTSEQGRAYAVESLGNWFKKQCLAAGITEGSAHGLRKSGATRLAEAGATEWEIASFLAHKDTKAAAVYVRKANRARMASNGMAKLGKISETKSD